MSGADRRIAGLWLGLLAFFVYGSWAPLELTAQAPAEAWRHFLALPAPWHGPASRTDLAANFLLTLPLAFGGAYLISTLAERAWRWGLMALLWPAMVLLSVGVEFGQVYFPPRTPSWTDVAMQLLGSTTGLLLYLALGERAHRGVAALSARLPVAQRLERWLFVYLMLLLAWQLMPLDLSLSPVELYRKWRDGRVVLLPFSALPPGGFDAAWQLGADFVIWLPVGALGWLSLARPGLAGLLGRGVALVAGVEFVQLFVMSRVTDVTDVLVGAAGVLGGALLARALRRWQRWPVARQRALLGGAFALWLVLAVCVLWLPFDFDAARGTPAAWWASVSRLPFSTYLQRTEYGALGEILRKLAVFVPGGLLLALLAHRQDGPEPAAWPRVLALAALALLLEAGQVLLPAKLADLTDAVLGLLGGVIGWQLGRGLALASADELRPSAAAHPSLQRRRRRRAAWAGAPAESSWPAAAPGRVPRALRGLLTVALLAVTLWLLARLPGVPYNVAKLMPVSAAGVLSALGVSLALVWIAAAPVWLLPPERRAWRLAFPLLLLGHGLVSFAALRLLAPTEMLHKVIGTPVLGWGAATVLEEAGRYLALHAALMLPLVGAVSLVRLVTAPRTLADLLWWAACAALLFGPVHGVVVVGAGTDNLVELMRGGGGVGASLALAAGWGALATAGASLAAALAAGASRAWRRAPLLLLAALALMLAPGFLVAGLEPVLVKYDRVFSAAQFILSAGRDRYAQGPELLLRAAVALAGTTALLALLQAPAWRALARSLEPSAPAEPARARQGLPGGGAAPGAAG